MIFLTFCDESDASLLHLWAEGLRRVTSTAQLYAVAPKGISTPSGVLRLTGTWQQDGSLAALDAALGIIEVLHAHTRDDVCCMQPSVVLTGLPQVPAAGGLVCYEGGASMAADNALVVFAPGAAHSLRQCLTGWRWQASGLSLADTCLRLAQQTGRIPAELVPWGAGEQLAAMQPPDCVGDLPTPRVALQCATGQLAQWYEGCNLTHIASRYMRRALSPRRRL